MSRLDAWLGMVHGVQAMRRRVERDSVGLLGALGVAVEPLPHQIANVRRILEAPEIRHLIADGVGMGKTVQTLMILNVLRLAMPDHRCLLVAPDHLVRQWMTEFMTRGHVSPRTATPGVPIPSEGSVVIVRPSDLVERTELLRDAADRFDMLVVDEPQTFTVQTRRALLRARPFAEFLALTATPEFGRDEMRDWFLGMLEPTNASRTDRQRRGAKASRRRPSLMTVGSPGEISTEPIPWDGGRDAIGSPRPWRSKSRGRAGGQFGRPPPLARQGKYP